MKKYIFTIIVLLSTAVTRGQTLNEFLEKAKKNYPLLVAKQHEISARQEQLSYIRSTALPSMDMLYQVNYATYNNITGLAVSTFVPISGPPVPVNVFPGVFGSAGSIMLNWEPFTFGQRKAAVHTAESYLHFQEADADQEIFQHQLKVISKYLDVVFSAELIKVFSKNLERAEENTRIVKSLAGSGLRPGVDTAMFQAESVRARIELLNYDNQFRTFRTELSEFIGGEPVNDVTDSIYFESLPTIRVDSATGLHPLIRIFSERVNINLRERIALQRTLFPRLSFWGTAYGRGSGIAIDGTANPEEGLTLSHYNYGGGLILSIPILRFANLRHLVSTRNSLIHAEEERLNLVRLQLEKQKQVAEASLDNAFKIASESPVFYQSAELAYRALLSRYNSGLVNSADLILAQYTLIKAESDMKKSYIDVWKALLNLAAVEGDLGVFMDQL
ncbi:MAG TPA: TolC family protein [Cyclobacteriaceae bacterium]|nr:TolC family protein [Cyclobacteriaceae bacterium]